MSEYTPQPIDTSGVNLPADLDELTEHLAENAHENWVKQRISEGWELGETLDDRAKIHPHLLPYAHLPKTARAHSRTQVLQTLDAMARFGEIEAMRRICKRGLPVVHSSSQSAH